MAIYSFRAFQVDNAYYSGEDGFIVAETTVDIFDTDGSLHQTPAADPDNDQTFSIGGGAFTSDYSVDFQDFSVINGGSAEFEIFAFEMFPGTPSSQYFVFSKDPGFTPSPGDALTVSRYNNFTITDYGDIESSICLAAGTHVTTSSGERRIEDLRPGDLVLTFDNGYEPIEWISHSHIGPKQMRLNPANRPVVIPAGRFGNYSDVLLSQQHAIHTSQITLFKNTFPDHLVRPKHLATHMGGGVRVARGKREITYYHMLLARHELICAGGLWVESLRLSAQSFQAMNRRKLSKLSRIRTGVPRRVGRFTQVLEMSTIRPTLIAKHVKFAVIAASLPEPRGQSARQLSVVSAPDGSHGPDHRITRFNKKRPAHLKAAGR